MGNLDSNNVWINLKYAPGTSLSVNQQATSEIASATVKYFQTILSGTLKDISVDLGQGYSLEWGGGIGSNLSSFTIRLVDTDQRDISSYMLVEQMQKQFLPLVKSRYPILSDMSIFTVQAWGGSGKPIAFSIAGENYQTINTYIQSILPEVKKIPWVYNLTTSLEYTNGKIVYVLDENKAKELGINSMSVVSNLIALKNSDYESNGIKIKEFSDFGPEALSLNAFLSTDMPLEQTKLGKIALEQLIQEKRLQPEINAIQRSDAKKVITVQADKEASAVLTDITAQIEKILLEHPLPSWLENITWGDAEELAQSMSDLGFAMIIWLVLMLLILVVQFNNFKYAIVIVSSVFLSLGGTVGLLALTGINMTFPAMIWIFGVLGVGVNQALIHIEDFIYYYREKKLSVIDSFQQSIAERFIPIFLTKATTIIGLIILAVKDELLGSMAVAFIWGLIMSFFITLLYIPSLMNLVNKEYYGE